MLVTRVMLPMNGLRGREKTSAKKQISICSLPCWQKYIRKRKNLSIQLRKWWLKALANEDPLLRTHCCRHKCFPICPRAQHLLRAQKMFLTSFRNILCPQQMFPSLRSPRKIMSNNVSATMCPRLPGPLAGKVQHNEIAYFPKTNPISYNGDSSVQNRRQVHQNLLHGNSTKNSNHI